MNNLIKNTHPQWQPLLLKALSSMDQNYLSQLKQEKGWLPGYPNIFAAFSQPLDATKYILLGESPYPRSESANGYAFWDESVKSIWSETGLSKAVNRATSLRNIMKMLLIARGDLQSDLSQDAIAKLDKNTYCQTAEEFFRSMMEKGFLLLNATLVYSEGEVKFHARHWKPFMTSLFLQLKELPQSIEFILFGRIAADVPEARQFDCLVAEHPYNISFITNPDVLDFFKPLDLLSCHND